MDTTSSCFHKSLFLLFTSEYVMYIIIEKIDTNNEDEKMASDNRPLILSAANILIFLTLSSVMLHVLNKRFLCICRLAYMKIW